MGVPAVSVVSVMPAASAASATSATSVVAPRMPLLDAVKGLACVAIVGHHLSRYGPLPESAASLAPSVFAWLSHDGRLAVQVFLVLAGFLAAGSLAPDGVLCAGRSWTRVLHRYARLVMPYMVALGLSMLVAMLVRPWLGGDTVPAAPGWPQLLAHLLFLQDLLGYADLSAGVWYVAIDFQLFVLALATVGLAGLLQRHAHLRPERSRWLAVALVFALAVASLADFNRHQELDVTALYFFGAYGLGMLVFWIGRTTRRSTWLACMFVLGMVGASALALDWRSRIAIALVTALGVAIAQRLDWLGTGGRLPFTRALARLGRISYSLFLIHFPVLLLVNAAFGRSGPVGAWIGMLGLAIAFVLSIAAAAILYCTVESRPATWRALGVLFAGLLACAAVATA